MSLRVGIFEGYEGPTLADIAFFRARSGGTIVTTALLRHKSTSGDLGGALEQVHAAQSFGHAVPNDFLATLTQRMPEPRPH